MNVIDYLLESQEKSTSTTFCFLLLFKNYVNIMFVKHLLFQSKTEYHAGNQAQTDRKYGIKLARYEVSEIET